MPTPAQIKKIHTLKNALALDDTTYRATLGEYKIGRTKLPAESSKDLTPIQADQLIQDLEAKATAAGVWERRKPARAAKSPRKLADDPQSKKIRQLWIELHQLGKVRDSSEKALLKYVKRMTHVDRLEWLSVNDASKVIEALKKWKARKEKGE